FPRKPGVFAYQDLKAAVEERWITATVPIGDAQLQPASLDLRLGEYAYQIRASFLPFRESVGLRLAEDEGPQGGMVIDRLDLNGGALLARGAVYVIPLLESLNLPKSLRGRCNPKSTTGRLDIFTRLITDETGRFDEI